MAGRNMTRAAWLRANRGLLSSLDTSVAQVRDFIRAADYSPAHHKAVCDELASVALSEDRAVELLWNAAARQHSKPNVALRALFADLARAGANPGAGCCDPTLSQAGVANLADERWRDATLEGEIERDVRDAVAAVVDGYAVQAVWHDKRGCNVWLAVRGRFVSKATWQRELDRCKALGGWYCRAWNGAPGGFCFTTEAAAVAFAGERLVVAC